MKASLSGWISVTWMERMLRKKGRESPEQKVPGSQMTAFSKAALVTSYAEMNKKQTCFDFSHGHFVVCYFCFKN
jgi:hypothetical protein